MPVITSDVLSEINHPGYSHYHLLDKSLSLETLSNNYHCHQKYEIYYYISGDVSFIVEGNQYELDKPCFLIIRPMEFHNVVFHSTARYEHFFINFDPEALQYIHINEQLLEPILRHPPGTNNLYPVSENGPFHKIFAQLKNAATLPEPERHMQAEFLLGELLLQISLKLKHEYTDFTHPQSNTLINDVLTYLNANITENLTIEQLAGKFFVSKYYLCHLFKKTTNISINEYVLQKRIAMAKRLLESGIRPTDVATRCGFTGYSTFYRAFKRLTNRKPDDYKQGKN